MRRALIVGIDDYPDIPLRGCVNDALRLSQVLSRHHDGSLNFQCDVLTGPPEKISRALLRRKVSDLFGNPADVAFFHFSGHGTINGLGGYLVTPDYCDFDVGIAMTEVLALANQSDISETFITLDCCHSGAFGHVPAISNDKTILSEGVSVITATRSGQEAIEEGGGGVFTSLLVEALEGGAAGLLGEVSAASVYAYIENAMGAWEQRPLFKANVSRFVRLRMAPPQIELDLLRRLTEYFPLPAEQFPLSPEYEPELEPHSVEKEAIFRDLVRLKYAALVEPVGEEHMYYAALNSKACALTRLGKYYWRLLKENKL
jgi:hypothetical protein